MFTWILSLINKKIKDSIPYGFESYDQQIRNKKVKEIKNYLDCDIPIPVDLQLTFYKEVVDTCESIGKEVPKIAKQKSFYISLFDIIGFILVLVGIFSIINFFSNSSMLVSAFMIFFGASVIVCLGMLIESVIDSAIDKYLKNLK
jgi:hypothetical protein